MNKKQLNENNNSILEDTFFKKIVINQKLGHLLKTKKTCHEGIEVRTSAEMPFAKG